MGVSACQPDHIGLLGLAYFLNFRLAAHTKPDNFRILVQEPLLDDRVAERLAVTLGNQPHFAELVVILFDGFRIAVGHDVVFHELIGQAVVAFLVGIALDCPLDDLVVGIIAANLLKVGILFGTGVGSELGNHSFISW